MVKRLGTAVVYGLSAVGAALQLKMPTNRNEWFALLGVFTAAAYGKFSTETSVVAPNRTEWTEEQKREAAAKKDV